MPATGVAGTAPSQAVDVCASGTYVFVAWQDGRVGLADVYVQASIDGGRTFMAHERRVDSDAELLEMLELCVMDTENVALEAKDEEKSYLNESAEILRAIISVSGGKA